MVFKSLLVGVNYLKSNKYRLSSPINDVKLMKDFLINYCNTKDDDIMILSDSPEYKEAASFFNIIKHIKLLAEELTSEDFLFMYFSGHGSSVPDGNRDEKDKRDEVFLTQDWQISYISDDLFNSLLKKFNCRVCLMFDCCNSGTICDLKYSYNIKDFTCTEYIKKDNKNFTDIICFSSSGENSNSFEKFINKNAINTDENKFYGEFTIFFLHILKSYLEDNLSFEELTYNKLMEIMNFYTNEFDSEKESEVIKTVLHKNIYSKNLRPNINFSFNNVKNYTFFNSRTDDEKKRYENEGTINKLKKKTMNSLSYKLLRTHRKNEFLEKKIKILTDKNNKLINVINKAAGQHAFNMVIR